MSLLELFRKKIKVELFTTPSHSQNFFIFNKFQQFYKHDISETDSHNPQLALDSAQKKASKIYGTKSTHFLTNGSTSGVIAAVLACVNRGDKVLIWNNAHPCHANAIKLAGAEPVFYILKKNEEWGIYGETPAEILEEKLKENDGKIKAVIVTSPTYEGIVSDIKTIAKICHKYGAYLIVDEAWGALYPFCEKLPDSAIYQGSDFVNQSLHKTAGGLNPTALLHCNSLNIENSFPRPLREREIFQHEERVSENWVRGVQNALDIINTTSPSYPLLLTIEKNINYINSAKGRKKISELTENIEMMKSRLSNVEFCNFNDPTKILIKVSGKTGEELSDFLYEHGIEDERTNDISTMLVCGLGTDDKKLSKLEKILKKL